jgi:ferredoxin
LIANYGYADGSGEYFIAIDTDRCDGCGECVAACPKGVFEVALDDYDNMVARVKEDLSRSLSYVCPGYERCQYLQVNCHSACARDAISHTW